MKKIYDCFIFNNELDLLEIRLNILKDIVDKFILVEGKKTFQNSKKELYYLSNKERFEHFHDKIIHIVVDEDLFIENTWSNERLSFNKILEGLSDARDDDLICISSLDEIPDPNVIRFIKGNINEHVHLRQRFYYYYLNTRFNNNGDINWIGTSILPYGILKTQEPYDCYLADKNRKPILENAGWHFAFLGGTDLIYNKLQSYSHNEYNYINKMEIEERCKNLIDPLNRSNVRFYRVENIDDLPFYIKENVKKYEYLLLLNT